ncbi:MAG: hypothetical protein K8J31_26415 [Anaerolineae bacterium]|nr:hypothetical protein [Anaerolineae bacterium]
MDVERVVWHAWLRLACGLLVAGCASIPSTTRIALLAPFEGRYREAGYNALYAARLAFQDAGLTSVELLPADDGGSVSSAADRAQALRLDPQVAAVLILGTASADVHVLHTFEELPVIVIGDWGAQPTDSAFILSNPEIDDRLTVPPQERVTQTAKREESLIAGDSLALAQWTRLRPASKDVTILSSAALPNPSFAARYRGSDLFAPEPGLLASLAYDATHMALQAVQIAHSERSAVAETLATMTYAGMNGTIHFEDGYWADAPLHTYRYDAEGVLRAAEDIVK